ncbi:hypothetical protein [Sphingomonas sp. Leaf412]|uniref:hypothetical protein n=1 Tax=Sphingomonas sp. Leaf412 TaxID=1736370 RepID=UPI000A60BCAE|nr:hypothetical protein [Sphingomonas sp. Leaf412]
MAPPPDRPTAAGGFPIAAGALLGTVAGLFAGQPSIGFLAGLAVGVAIAIAIWLRDR